MDSLGKILLELGELHQAGELHQQILTLAEEQTLRTGQPPPGVGVAHCGLAVVLYERNDLKTALIHAEKGIEIFKPWGITEHLLDSYDVLARIKLAQGDVSGALSMAQTAVSLVQEPQVPDWLQAMTVARKAAWKYLLHSNQR